MVVNEAQDKHDLTVFEWHLPKQGIDCGMLCGTDPTKRNPPGAGLSEGTKAEFPPEKMEEFGGKDRGPPGATNLATTMLVPH